MKKIDFCLAPVLLYYLMGIELWLGADSIVEFVRFAVIIPSLIYLASRIIAARFQTVTIRFKPQFAPRCYDCEDKGRKYWVEKVSNIVETWDPTHKRSVKVYKDDSCYCSNRHKLVYHPDYGTFISGVGPRFRGQKGWLGQMTIPRRSNGRSRPAPQESRTSRTDLPGGASASPA